MAETRTEAAPSLLGSEERAQPRLISLLLCDYASETRDGKYNLMGIFDRIRLGKETVAHTFFVYVRTANTVDEPVRINVYSPLGQPVAWVQFAASFKHPELDDWMQPQIAVQINFTPPMLGRYWLEATYQGRALGGLELVVDREEADGDVDDG